MATADWHNRLLSHRGKERTDEQNKSTTQEKGGGPVEMKIKIKELLRLLLVLFASSLVVFISSSAV